MSIPNLKVPMHGPHIARLNPTTLATPPGYSQVVLASGKEMIFIAGQVALDKEGQLVGAGDAAAQANQVFSNLVAALEAVGGHPRQIVKLTTFITDMATLPAFREARDRFLDPDHPPASTLVEVERLFGPDFLIEVEAVAVR